MKNPNGYGSVYKLSGKRRNPYRAIITTGFVEENERAVQKRYTLGYYPTRQDAMIALAEYNKCPYKPDKTTFEDLFQKWIDGKELKKNTYDNTISRFRKMRSVASLYVTSVTLKQLQEAIDKDQITETGMNTAKTIITGILDYAKTNGYNVPAIETRLLKTDVVSEKHERRVWTKEEIVSLWEQYEQTNNIYDGLALVLLYTGCRSAEILALREEDIHDGYFHVKDSKTSAGIRDVPIAHRIAPILRFLVSSDKLHYSSDTKRSNGYKCLERKIKEYGHSSHDCRHTFITRMVEMGIDERYIKVIVGHKDNSNVTRSVYTHLSIEKLMEVMSDFDY